MSLDKPCTAIDRSIMLMKLGELYVFLSRVKSMQLVVKIVKVGIAGQEHRWKDLILGREKFQGLESVIPACTT